MRTCLKIILPLLFPVLCKGQDNRADSLRKIFFRSNDDSITYKAAGHLYEYYEEENRDSALYYSAHCVQVSRSHNKKLNEAYFLTRKAYQQLNLGRYAESLQSLLEIG